MGLARQDSPTEHHLSLKKKQSLENDLVRTAP